MTIEQAYLNFLNLVNRNLTNNNVNVDKPRFVLMFNDIQLRFEDYLLEKKFDESAREVSHLLQTDKALTLKDQYKDKDSYKLPEDYFDLSNLHVYANKEKCKNIRLHTFEVKSEDTEELLNDKNNQPSFEYRETFYFTSGDKTVSVFKKDFEINSVELTYYKRPREVDIEGYTKLDGSTSTSIDPEWSDLSINKILLAMSKEFSAINSDANGYNLSKDRLFQPL